MSVTTVSFKVIHKHLCWVSHKVVILIIALYFGAKVLPLERCSIIQIFKSTNNHLANSL